MTLETVWSSHKEVDDPSSVTHGILSLRSDAAGLENCAGRIEMGCESDGRRGESTEDLQFCFYFCFCVVKSLSTTLEGVDCIFAHEKQTREIKRTFFEHSGLTKASCCAKNTPKTDGKRLKRT